MRSIGIDIGSSSVKVSLLDIPTGRCVATSTNPKVEMPIKSLQSGWAEQDPTLWWHYVCIGIEDLKNQTPLNDVVAIGITYQMHGLVLIDKNGKPIRDAIIWCDSRAVGIGSKAFNDLGKQKCLDHLLGSPANFTASKMAWVIQNESESINKAEYALLPGDYIAYMLSGEVSTTISGLSEGVLYDFKEHDRADFLLDYYKIPKRLIPSTKGSIGIQSYTNEAVEMLFGIPKGTPISYRAGDQPNNALSLNVMEPGEVAATGGTSGVVYGVSNIPKADELSRVNTFLHVNHTKENPRYGTLLCINGTGIMNAWIKRNFAPNFSYPQMNELALTAPVGSAGVTILPFGNGAERVLQNRYTGSSIVGLDLNRHNLSHILRATHEGIAFSFCYGIEIMKKLGVKTDVIRAGKANMFLSPIFTSTLATLTGAKIEMYDTDGSLGAARGAALGCGYYKNREQAFASLNLIDTILPVEKDKQNIEQAYANWKKLLENILTI